MEEFEDDDFSDLYADVEVQASSAISAMHRLTGMRPGEDKNSDNATRGEKELGDGFSGAEIARGNHKLFEHGSGCEDVEGDEEEEDGGGSTNLLMDNGDICGSGSESEDELDNYGDDGCKQKFDDNYDDKYGNRASNIEFGVGNTSKRERGQEIEEDEKKRGGIDGNEKSVNGGDYNSQRKNLKYDTLNSKRSRVDEMARQVHKTRKQGDAGVGHDRDLCFSRAIEDNQPNFGRKYGGLKIASESSRHTHACNPVPLDLDKCGSVQISDSVEDNHCEVSDSDSDRMTEATETSDDTNRRKASRMSNKVSSAVEPESSQSGWSQHGRGSSCSPSRCVALSDRYIEKSHKHSKYPSSSLACELQEATTREYHPSKGSKSRCVKPSTRDGRYCERRRGIVRKHSDQQKKSNDMPYLKTRLTDEDASHAIDVKRLYNRHINHGKQRAMVSFDSNENDMPYRSQSERYLTYLGGVFPDSRLGPAYLKNQCRNIHPSCRYKSGWPDGYHISERQNFRGKKSSQINNEALEDDWYQNHWRHPVQGNIEGSRKLTPKYSSSAVNRRGTQFIYQGDGVHFRRRTIGDDLSPLHKYDNKFVEGKYRRIWPSIGRDRGHLDHRCDRNIGHDRREMESSGRDERRRDSPLNCLDNLWNIDTEVNDRRNIKHQPFPFYCPEEPCAPGRGQFAVASGPKSEVPERNVRCSWKEMYIESGRYGTNITTFDTRRRHYQQSSSTYVTNESIKDDHDFVRRRHHQHSEVLHSREEVHKSRQQDDTVFHSEGPSYHFKRFSRNNGADDRHAFGHVAELIDEREVNRQRSKMLREDHSNQFDRCHKSNQSHNHAQMLSRYQDSVERLVFVGKKCTTQSSRRTSEAGEDTYYGRRKLMGWNDNQKSKIFEDLGDFNPEKAVLTNEGKVDTSLSDKNRQNKFSGNQQNNLLDIEEGQIITEEINDLVKCVHASEDTIQINDMGHPETASNDIGVVESLDDQKIREIMVKMERRRERFKEPITSSRDSDKTANRLPDLDVETTEAKLERPARKRRWSGT